MTPPPPTPVAKTAALDPGFASFVAGVGHLHCL